MCVCVHKLKRVKDIPISALCIQYMYSRTRTRFVYTWNPYVSSITSFYYFDYKGTLYIGICQHILVACSFIS